MKRTMNCLLKNGWRITGASWTRKSSRLRPYIAGVNDADGWSDYHIIRHRSEEADTSREENLWLRLGISVRGSREDIERILNGDTETLRKLLDAGRYGIGGETYVPGSTVEGYNEDHDTEFEEEDVEFHL